MKKILGILLTAVMVCTSMGVLATGTDNNYVWYNSLEDYEVKAGAPAVFMYGSSVKNTTVSIVNTQDEGLPTVEGLGDKCLKIVCNASASGLYYTRQGDNYGVPALEPNTKYKYSFWWYPVGTGDKTSIPIRFGLSAIGGSSIRSLGQYYGLPNGEVNKWNYYEVYFYTKDDFGTSTYCPKVEMNVASPGLTQYYDMFAFEKVEDVSISFFDGNRTLGESDVSKMTDRSRYTPQTGHVVEAQNPSIYTVAANGIPVSTAQGKVHVVTHYTPNKLTEKNMLVVGIYQKDGDNDILRQVQIKTCEYTAEGDDLKYDSCIRHLTVDMADYPGCYIKAFMISDFSEMSPVSSVATLPAAQ